MLRSGEPRFLVIGMIKGKIWTGVITPGRGRAHHFRARARKEEVEHYGSRTYFSRRVRPPL